MISRANFRCWLQADIQSPEIEVRFTPNFGHSEAHTGLPLLTHNGPSGLDRPAQPRTLDYFPITRPGENGLWPKNASRDCSA